VANPAWAVWNSTPNAPDALKKSTETAAVACPLSDHYGFVAELELP